MFVYFSGCRKSKTLVNALKSTLGTEILGDAATEGVVALESLQLK